MRSCIFRRRNFEDQEFETRMSCRPSAVKVTHAAPQREIYPTCCPLVRFSHIREHQRCCARRAMHAWRMCMVTCGELPLCGSRALHSNNVLLNLHICARAAQNSDSRLAQITCNVPPVHLTRCLRKLRARLQSS